MKLTQCQVLAFILLTAIAGGCNSSVSPNESNVAGAAVDASTVPQGRDDMVQRQKQKIAEYQKSLAPAGRPPRRR